MPRLTVAGLLCVNTAGQNILRLCCGLTESVSTGAGVHRSRVMTGAEIFEIPRFLVVGGAGLFSQASWSGAVPLSMRDRRCGGMMSPDQDEDRDRTEPGGEN